MSELPFSNIEQTPEQYSSTNVMSRFVEALGFRYRWATEGLISNEYEFRPHETSQSIHELLEHLFSMANLVLANLDGESLKDDTIYSSEELRLKTLDVYQEINDRLKSISDTEFEAFDKIRIKNTSKPSFWLMLNGPISDSLTHVGQITSWRRIAGNPQPKGINVFRGRTNF
jgi:hypothetical protein